MTETISKLDTATTEELIDALTKRLGAQIGQATAQLDEPDTIIIAAASCATVFDGKVRRATTDALLRALGEHPALRDRTTESLFGVFRQLFGGR